MNYLNNFGSEQASTPDDLNTEHFPVQNFAVGGIAMPSQRAFLRGSDKAYLEARQAELDAFEKQRLEYNDALTKWQTEVYNPYKSQVDAYNAASQQYNKDVYEPYQQQVNAYNEAITKYNKDVYEPYTAQYAAYEKALNDWNAGPRTSDYAGPAAPTLASTFSMAAPTTPKAFEMQAPTAPKEFSLVAPTLPFKEEDVQKYQQEAATRARKDAGNRAVALDVASNPDEYNFGSMSVTNRFMAEGGPVDKEDDSYERESASRVIKDFEGFGYTSEEIRDLASEVADAGRGGDELLAYLSPESMAFLKSQGGSGTINPATGLPEFKRRRRAIAQAVQNVVAAKTPAATTPTPAPTPAPAPAAAAPTPAAPPPAPTNIQLTPVSLPTMATQPAPKAAADMLKELPAKAPPPAPAAPPPAPAAPPPPVVRDAISIGAIARPNLTQLSGSPSVRATSPVAAQPGTTAGPVAPGSGVKAMDPDFLRSISGPPPGATRSGGFGNALRRAAQRQRNARSDLRDVSDTFVPLPRVIEDTPKKDVGINPPVLPPSTPGFNPLPMPTFGQNPRPTPQPVGQENFFAMPNRPSPNQGVSPGTVAIGPSSMPVFGANQTLGAIAANPNLSPTMLGGQENAGFFTDRMGNQIYSPMMPRPIRTFADGGPVSLADIMAMNRETLSDEAPEEAISTDPVGTAQQYLADLSKAGERTTYEASPTKRSIKRTKVTPVSGKRGKGMALEYESLTQGEIGGKAPKARDTDSARGQLEELVRQYALKGAAAKNRARGLSADTFGAPTLEGPSLTKGSLTKKRFAKGGEAKKSEAEESEPGLLGVSDYATKAAERMFPGQMGQDDQRDAARHMLAAAMVARKTNPGTAEFLGKAHERLSNPESFFSMFGIGKPRDDYEMDVHNNRLGAELAARTKSQAELEKLVRAMALQSQNKQSKDKPWTMSREQMEARRNKGMTPPPEYAHGGAVHRAKGSPEEGEISDAEREAASRPAFVTPKSGKGRKRGAISDAINSGEALTSMAKGATELPYDIAGAPVDLATMLMRPMGYNVDKPVMGSDWIKSKMTGAGVRPEPPTDPTQRGFFTAGELLSNLTNPAGVTRAGVRGAQRAGKAASDVAADFQQYNRQLDVPGASYAVRPTGSTMLTGKLGFQTGVSGVDDILSRGMTNARSVAGQDEDRAKLIRDFWDTKGRNYFTRQFGTPDDPVAQSIMGQRIRSSALEETFPEYMLVQTAVGKTRVSPEGQTRFFPKFPRAVEDFTTRYDAATGLKGTVVSTDPRMGNPDYEYLLSESARDLANLSRTAQEDKMLSQGVRPELINPNVDVTARSAKNPERVLGGTRSAEDLLRAYEEAGAYARMTPEEQALWASEQFGKGRNLHGLDQSQVGENILSSNVKTAIDKGEPVYDIENMQAPLKDLFNPTSINRFLAELPARELANIRFEDAVRGAAKLDEQASELQQIVKRIKAGKPVADSVFSRGVSAPLLQMTEGPLEGFAWKRIEKREATVPEGAYVGHSVGGYELGGPTYTAEKRDGFNTGKWQVYTLRDNRNRPVNTIEVTMADENTPIVTQIKGNGRATGNTAPEKYDTAVLQFLQNYLKPAQIRESDNYLTPLLQQYKDALNKSRAK